MIQTVLLGDVIELAYGKGLPQRSRIPGRFPVFGSNGQVDTHNQSLANGPGVIVGRKGSVGEVIWSKQDFWPIDTTYYIRLKNPNDDLRYWYYALKTLGLDKLNSHSAIPGLNRSIAYAKQVPLHSTLDQKKIADILGSLDEKIEFNRRMNETLEQLGQALFRHYFVDNPEAKSWESGKVSDVVRIYSGFAFKSKDFDINGKYGLVTIKNVQDGSFIKDCTDHLSEPLPDKTPGYVHLKSGDIILSLTGNVGRVCIVVGCDYLLNQRVAKLVGDESQAYTYFLFRSKIMKGRMVGISKGTAQKNLSPIETGKLKIKIPPTNIMSQFEEIAIDLLNMIVSNNEQIQTLTSLRDSLLPKLISGEIEV